MLLTVLMGGDSRVHRPYPPYPYMAYIGVSHENVGEMFVSATAMLGCNLQDISGRQSSHYMRRFLHGIDPILE